MNRKRALTIDMIDKISRAWHIPVAALARPYALAAGPAVKSRGTRTGVRPRSRADVAPSGRQAKS
jgi:hypothetical protein